MTNEDRRAPFFEKMTKLQIIEIYRSADRGTRQQISRSAREWLASHGIRVTNPALHYWRNNPAGRSKIGAMYLRAYQQAVDEVLSNQTHSKYE